ncbi:MAG: hypothetical protein HXY39_00250 [Chloroflexi bacterium]|nr:hypothetical protein [Chloroflexota bacterium]
MIAAQRLIRPAALISTHLPPQRVPFRVSNGFDPRWLEGLPGVQRARRHDDQVTVDGDEWLLGRVTAALGERGYPVADLRAARPTLSAYPKTHGHAVSARSASDRLQRAQRG